MHLGMVTYQVAKDWDLDTMIDMCLKTGFEGVELRTTHAHGVEIALGAEERATAKAKFRDSGIVLWGLGTACEYHSPDPDEVRRNIEETKQFVVLARDTGAVGVKVRPNGFAEDAGVSKAQTLEQIGKALRECGEYAEDYGVELWVEVHGPGTSHPPYIKTIMDVCDHPLVGTCWNCNQGDIVDCSIEQYIRPLMPKIRQCHIHDLYEDYPYSELIRVLRDAKFDGFCNIEMPESAEPERLLKYYAMLWKAWTA